MDNLKIELDIFLDKFEGIKFAEIEFESEEQAKNIKLPNWFGREITNTLKNSMMASMKIDDVFKLINEN